MAKRNLFELSLAELGDFLAIKQIPKFRAKQIFNWLYQTAVTDFAKMQNLPKELRNLLAENFTISVPQIKTQQNSEDGTIKWLFELACGKTVETVYIPEPKRGTLCISSQVGCTLNCTFCHTGTQLLQKNLTAGEIIGQVYAAKLSLADFKQSAKKLTNIVYMGMGEPLLNYEEVKKSALMLIAPEVFDFSKRKITISTSGIIPNIYKLTAEIPTELAISFHAPNDQLRTEIMPINKKYPIADLLAACNNHAEQTKQLVTLEYVTLSGVNDSKDHALELAKLVKNFPVKINIIVFNAWPGTKYQRSSNNRTRAFADILQENGVRATIRRSRGDDILAACGQLKSGLL